MSLWEGFEYRGPPSMDDYRRAEVIPKSKRCATCDGTGLRRDRHSMTGIDWRKCWQCAGTGRKEP